MCIIAISIARIQANYAPRHIKNKHFDSEKDLKSVEDRKSREKITK